MHLYLIFLSISFVLTHEENVGTCTINSLIESILLIEFYLTLSQGNLMHLYLIFFSFLS